MAFMIHQHTDADAPTPGANWSLYSFIKNKKNKDWSFYSQNKIGNYFIKHDSALPHLQKPSAGAKAGTGTYRH